MLNARAVNREGSKIEATLGSWGNMLRKRAVSIAMPTCVESL